MTTTIKKKEIIFINQTFPDLSKELNSTPSVLELKVRKNDFITEKEMEKVLFKELIKKTPELDKLNFKTIRLLGN